MDKTSKISSYIMYGLLIVSILVSALVMFGGIEEKDPMETPIFTDWALNWAKLLIIGAICTTVVFEIYKIIMHPISAKKSLISTGALLLFLIIAYLFADGTPLTIIGYEGADNIPSMLKVTDTGLFTFYILMIAAVLAIIGTEIYNLFKS